MPKWADEPRCLGCGYLLVGLERHGFDFLCPECGRVFDPLDPGTFVSSLTRLRSRCAGLVAGIGVGIAAVPGGLVWGPWFAPPLAFVYSLALYGGLFSATHGNDDPVVCPRRRLGGVLLVMQLLALLIGGPLAFIAGLMGQK